jgi:hypothetical protein
MSGMMVASIRYLSALRVASESTCRRSEPASWLAPASRRSTRTPTRCAIGWCASRRLASGSSVTWEMPTRHDRDCTRPECAAGRSLGAAVFSATSPRRAANRKVGKMWDRNETGERVIRVGQVGQARCATNSDRSVDTASSSAQVSSGYYAPTPGRAGVTAPATPPERSAPCRRPSATSRTIARDAAPDWCVAPSACKDEAGNTLLDRTPGNAAALAAPAASPAGAARHPWDCETTAAHEQRLPWDSTVRRRPNRTRPAGASGKRATRSSTLRCSDT